MKDNRCPNCDLLNLPSSQTCLKCGTPLSNEPRKTDFKIAAETQNYTNPPAPPTSFDLMNRRRQHLSRFNLLQFLTIIKPDAERIFGIAFFVH